MPINIPADINKEKNKLSSPYAWVWLLDIDIDGVDETVRLVNNTENIPYDSNIYTRCNFNLGSFDDSESGRLPSRTLSVSNSDLVRYLLPYVDNYNGLVGASVIVTPVNTGFLNLDYSSKAQEYEISTAKISETIILFNLSSPSPLTQRLQQRKYFGLLCSYVSRFKGVECKYAGAETACNGSLERCFELNNEANNGGFPGMRSKSIRIV